MRRPHPWLVTTDREARSPPAPDEGAAFNGWTGLDERQRQCCPDNVRCKSPVQAKKCGGRVKNRRGGAPGGARAGHTARGRLREVPSCDLRRSGAPLPHGRGRRNEGAGPAPTAKGADESRPYVIETARESAGCLTTESEDQNHAGAEPSWPAAKGRGATQRGQEFAAFRARQFRSNDGAGARLGRIPQPPPGLSRRAKRPRSTTGKPRPGPWPSRG